MMNINHLCECGTKVALNTDDCQIATCNTCGATWKLDTDAGEVIRLRVRSFRDTVNNKGDGSHEE